MVDGIITLIFITSHLPEAIQTTDLHYIVKRVASSDNSLYSQSDAAFVVLIALVTLFVLYF